MGEITRQPARAIQNALIDSVLAGLCALIVFGPIVGVVLKGYGFTLAPARVAILVAVVMAGRLALSLLLQSHRGKAFIARFEGADDGVYVRPPGYRSRLRWIIPLLVGLAIVFPFLATKYLLTVAILGLIYVLLGLGLNIVVASRACSIWAMWRFTPSAPTAWRWATSTWASASGRCCRWGR